MTGRHHAPEDPPQWRNDHPACRFCGVTGCYCQAYHTRFLAVLCDVPTDRTPAEIERIVARLMVSKVAIDRVIGQREASPILTGGGLAEVS